MKNNAAALPRFENMLGKIPAMNVITRLIKPTTFKGLKSVGFVLTVIFSEGH